MPADTALAIHLARVKWGRALAILTALAPTRQKFVIHLARAK
jgi:hypothetical protein